MSDGATSNPSASPNPPQPAEYQHVDLRRRWKIGSVLVGVVAVGSVVVGLTLGSPSPDVVIASANPFLIVDSPRPGVTEASVSLGFVFEILNQRDEPAKLDSVVVEATPQEQVGRTCAATGPVRLETAVGKELKTREELYLTVRSGFLYSVGADSSTWARPCLALKFTVVVGGETLELTPSHLPDAQFIPGARWGAVDDLVTGEHFVRASVHDLLKSGGALLPAGSGAPAVPAPASAEAPATAEAPGAPPAP